MNLVLRTLTSQDEEAFLQGSKEWVNGSPHWYSFFWTPEMPYSEMLTILNKESKGIDLLPGRVQHTMLYAFLGDKIIGRLSVRHELNDNLRKRGGHIGYAVAPSYRRQGYGTEITRQGIEFCKSLGLNEIMVTCSDENEPSWKIIEHFNGKLQDKVWDDEDKEMIRRYWIAI